VMASVSMRPLWSQSRYGQNRGDGLMGALLTDEDWSSVP